MTNETRTLETVEAALDGCWVVFIWDPDGGRVTEWPVQADELGEAVTKAVVDWRSVMFPYDPDPDEQEADLEKPHILRVYRNSWLAQLEWAEYDGVGLGSYDMSKLANDP
ncbi:hypothetical protein [Brevundimonas sp.]|uniref:hypothetical protein n=1 Tax=Brevundimonas sp. TaxID=1871086 RepID=UPI002602072E|nr:hypothetical protein [Brevundimonas sp.]